MPNLSIRPATKSDVPTIFQLIQALAEYEQLEHAVTGSESALEQHLFGNSPYANAILAIQEEKTVGFALWFTTYSTFLTQPGMYLEDLFVLPEYRRSGIGKALLSYLAQIAIQQNYGRFEWSVLDWNAPAINFYQSIGATVRPDWRICRMTGDALSQLAKG